MTKNSYCIAQNRYCITKNSYCISVMMISTLATVALVCETVSPSYEMNGSHSKTGNLFIETGTWKNAAGISDKEKSSSMGRFIVSGKEKLPIDIWSVCIAGKTESSDIFLSACLADTAESRFVRSSGVETLLCFSIHPVGLDSARPCHEDKAG